VQKLKPFKTNTIAALTAGALLATVGVATAAEKGDGLPDVRNGAVLERGLVYDSARDRYDDLYAKAKELGVAPKRAASERTIGLGELRDAESALRKEVDRARPEVGTPESVGVSQGTLESIAACESGGDPAAVSSDGTYRGKYQFDYGTWASVGGSGDPAAAPEEEQDYRAALLYSQSGSSPWPICGS
jgi:hypothetical protein